ncbi:MAG: response regulator transcription factor [Candidatus Chisholmbacteria bacterium]|nr:response regulator transcription factor [Candidatus Chisholmbacteria bacterium]
MATILVIEDDQPLLSFVVDFLKDEGFIVAGTGSGARGLATVASLHPDLVILDLGLPDIAGETVLTQIKDTSPEIPIIILTAKAQLNSIVQSLNLGADDYLAKPFEIAELLARIKARLRVTANINPLLTIDHLKVNLDTREATRQNRPLPLTKTEFDLLTYLLKNKNKVLTRTMILNHVWDFDSDVESRVVDAFISSLRKKVDSGFRRKLIHNKRGVGYVLKD